MKTLKNLILLFVVSLFACTGNNSKQTHSDSHEIDYEAEKKAIMDVIEAESEAFWKKDFDAYAAHWAHEDYIRTMGWWEAGGVTVVEGWEERARRTKQHMAQSPEENATATQVRRENVNLRIYEDVAWLTFDQYGEDTGDTLMDMPGLSRETRIFEKLDGEWKIVYLGWLLEGDK
jgi:hypothetical protein